MNYYNEFDPFAAAWLRELISEKLIPAGHVDTRSIADVSPADLRGFTQCHFFAGIGGWALALRLAGWPDDQPVWTGSCPCQPFSAAGKQKGTDDERHLWPEFRRLISECRPAVVFGEQVASRLGREWLAGVRADLEGLGYAVGAADLCAAGVGAPHIRQRLYWGAGGVDNAQGDGRSSGAQLHPKHDREEPVYGRESGGVAHATGTRLPWGKDGRAEGEATGKGWMLKSERGRDVGRMADASGERRTGERVLLRSETEGRDEGGVPQTPGSGGTAFWSRYDLIPCRDGKVRRVEPGTFPLAHGVSGRVGLLRGYGNAIVPQVAATFIAYYYECLNDMRKI